MIEHHPDPSTGLSWPAKDDRPRRWSAIIFGQMGPVVLRHDAILEPGEDLTEYPKTLELTIEEWRGSHAKYGLDLDGIPLDAD